MEGRPCLWHWCVSGPEGGRAGQGKQGHPLHAGETLGLESEQGGPAWCLWSPATGQVLALWMEERGSVGLWIGPGHHWASLRKRVSMKWDWCPAPIPSCPGSCKQVAGRMGTFSSLSRGVWVACLESKAGRRKQKERLARKSLSITKTGFSLN